MSKIEKVGGQGKDIEVGMKEGRQQKEDFRLRQLDIGSVENAKFRRKWWQLWCVPALFSMAMTGLKVLVGFLKTHRLPQEPTLMMHRCDLSCLVGGEKLNTRFSIYR